MEHRVPSLYRSARGARLGSQAPMTIRVGSDDAERDVLSDVEEYGWHCLGIHAEGDSAPWAFTIGLHETWNFPELIIVGLKSEIAHAVFNIIAVGLAKGSRPDLGALNGDLVEGPFPMARERERRIRPVAVGSRSSAAWLSGS